MRTVLPQNSILTRANSVTIDAEKLGMLSNLLKNLVFQVGEPTKSGFQKHEDTIYGEPVPTTLISESTISEGAGHTVGLKSYRWTDIDFTNKKITFNSAPLEWEVDDVISIVNDAKYIDCSRITNIDGNVVTVDKIPFSSIVQESQFDSKTAYVINKPYAGDVDIGVGAHAEGIGNQAMNFTAHAEGSKTSAIGQYSHAEGRKTVAAYASHAEGWRSQAIGEASHAEGLDNVASGFYGSHVEGRLSKAVGETSHAEGRNSTAYGKFSHAEGESTNVIGKDAHVEGLGKKESITPAVTCSAGSTTYQIGSGNGIQVGMYVYYNGIFGKVTSVTAVNSATVAIKTDVSLNPKDAMNNATIYKAVSYVSGDYSHGEGEYVKVTGTAAHAEGFETEVLADYGHAEGQLSKAMANVAHAEGHNTVAAGQCSHSEGVNTRAIGNNSHSEGSTTRVIGEEGHAEGIGEDRESTFEVSAAANATTFTTLSNHDLKVGDMVYYNGIYAKVTAVPDKTHFSTNTKLSVIVLPAVKIRIVNGTAFGPYSHSEGKYSIAVSEASHAEGSETRAEGNCSHAEGLGTITSGQAEHAQGQYNVSHSTTIHSVGIGASHTERKNAVEVLNDGKVFIKGVGTYDGIDPSAATDVATVIERNSSNKVDKVPTATVGNLVAFDTNGNIKDSGTKSANFVRTSGNESITGHKKFTDNVTVGTRLATGSVGIKSVTMGSLNVASGNFSVAEGAETTASADSAHAEGYQTTASGPSSHAEGHNTEATANRAHAEGSNTHALGDDSHAEGNNTRAIGNNSHAEGYYPRAQGSESHAEGYITSAVGNRSHAEGDGQRSLIPNITFSGEANATTYTTSANHSLAVNNVVFYGDTFARITSVPQANKFTVNVTLSPEEISNKELTIVNGCALGQSSHSEGHYTSAIGQYSHAEGSSTTALGSGSHTEGNLTNATGEYSHAEGAETEASSFRAHAEGALTKATNEDAHAEGNNTTASGKRAHAEGYSAKARSDNSHAEGYMTYADGEASHAEGNQAKSAGNYSHAEGYITTSIGSNSHAEGKGQRSSSTYKVSGEANATTYTTSAPHGLVIDSIVCYDKVFAKVTAVPSTTSFTVNVTLSTSRLTNVQITLVSGCAFGENSHVEGYYSKAVGESSHAEGSNTVASGPNSHAEGSGAKATSFRAHAEGANTTASNEDTHAEGLSTTASGKRAHAEGISTEAQGANSHAEGNSSKAYGENSHAEGLSTITNNSGEHAEGKYNVSNTGTIHSIGIGTGNSNRTNAVEVFTSGSVFVQGIGNYDGKNATSATTKSVQQVINELVSNVPTVIQIKDSVTGTVHQLTMSNGQLIVDNQPV